MLSPARGRLLGLVAMVPLVTVVGAVLANHCAQRQLYQTAAAGVPEPHRLVAHRVGSPIEGNTGCVVHLTLAAAGAVPSAVSLRSTAGQVTTLWCVREGGLSWFDGRRCVPLQRAGASYRAEGADVVDMSIGSSRYQELVALAPSGPPATETLLLEQTTPIPVGWRRLDPRCWDGGVELVK